jgi:hypothetical protein
MERQVKHKMENVLGRNSGSVGRPLFAVVKHDLVVLEEVVPSSSRNL